jgi:hypothetical protein
MMKKLLAIVSILAAAFVPTVSTATHCTVHKTAELWSDYGAVYSDELGRAGCGEGRAEIADTNYVSPASEFVYMVALEPNASAPSQAPTSGVLKFNNSANKTLIFTWGGSFWESNHITIPEGASSVRASACIRPEAGQACRTVTLNYQVI